ncbi:Transient receptor putative cation channel sub A member 1 [Madurella fahalii]|uniref:Transient receptor putative cation channel sub A member 1 n=1 Tax=Madurella fahalii TaxID=1157608 RepID=A0ABQ0GK75_9PEZI
MIYGILLQQQRTMSKIESGEILNNNVINMAVISQTTAQSTPAVLQAQLSEVTEPESKQSANTLTRPSKVLPRKVQFERWGFSAQLVALPRDQGASYHAAVRVSLLGKIYSVQMHMSWLGLSFDGMLHVHNIFPANSEIVFACRGGDFNRIRELLEGGWARGSDVTDSGWPMLDFAIQSGSARLVRLLLEHGAGPDMVYGEQNMSALQSSFLHGEFDIARILLTRGADIEHVDSDGFSVLSYLWVVDGKLDKSVDFMRLCLANDFSQVNACDNRGWTAFHRAAAIGTPEDVETFLKLGASLSLRAEWYGWTPLFFASSHDNVETSQTILKHSGPDAYESLDDDGWNLLHCCVYFGAPRVMRLVLQNGIDINQKTLPAPLPEDPELSYRELTASDIAYYIGPNRFKMYMDALAETGRDGDLDEYRDVFWDAADSKAENDDMLKEGGGGMVYGAEDVDDRWTLLHWASYNGSPKIKKLFLLKGANPEHMDGIILENNPTLLPTSPFEGR